MIKKANPSGSLTITYQPNRDRVLVCVRMGRGACSFELFPGEILTDTGIPFGRLVDDAELIYMSRIGDRIAAFRDELDPATRSIFDMWNRDGAKVADVAEKTGLKYHVAGNLLRAIKRAMVSTGLPTNEKEADKAMEKDLYGDRKRPRRASNTPDGSEASDDEEAC